MLLILPVLKSTPNSSLTEKDGDLKTQVEKLWREVNALKEMQALQTGKTPLHQCLPKGDREGAGHPRGLIHQGHMKKSRHLFEGNTARAGIGVQ